MNYRPIGGVWEITFACNMRCKHCGSSCDNAAQDELTTAEALDLCRQLGELGMKFITLSGGEPLIRKDWDKIAAELRKNNIIPNILSNGWFIDDKIIDRAFTAGISNIGVSLDGLKDTHDFIRCNGSYDRVVSALQVMRTQKMPSVVITSINKKNILQLPEIWKVLKENRVRRWQLQLAIPMGNLTQWRDLVVEPHQIESIVDFAYEVKDKDIIIELGDNLGYYSIKDVDLRQSACIDDKCTGVWNGCAAGKYSIGIRCNGDITGCNSLRDTDSRYLEGNIRDTSLKEIWERPGAFAWNRDFSKKDLTGFCAKCTYSDACKAGCTSLKESMGNSTSTNTYCMYYNKIMEESKKFQHVDDIKILADLAQQAVQDEEYQLAEIILSKILEMKPDSTGIFDLLGFVHYNLGNLELCRQMNLKSLELNPENAYAHKGLGIVLADLGDVESGIASLKKSIQLADPEFTDPYHDLAVVLYNNNRPGEALEILEAGRRKSPHFKENTTDFYNTLKKTAVSLET